MSNSVDEITRISLPYGHTAVEVEIPSQNLLAVAGPRQVSVEADLNTLIRQAVRDPINRQPFSATLQREDRLLMLVDDLTRPTPIKAILPILLEELAVEQKRVEDGRRTAGT